VIANAMATLDQIAEGRITLGLGGGWMEAEYAAYGMPYPSAGVRLRQLNEAIQCVRGLLTQSRTDFDGEFFTMRDAQCEPKPVQVRLPIWIGGGGEKVTLRIAAQHADGWNVPFIAPDAFVHKVEVLDQHCETVGRDPSQIERAINVGIAMRPGDLEAQFGPMANYVAPGVLQGSVQEIVDRVGAYRDAGADWVILAMRAPFDIDGLDMFAAEVLPHL
jgi:alkanesulfonate monooxygenase SsuD/methylene tetrahydromethanopterin reductase-like flavin-dependent oxidoreductase (luciferase family)